MVARVDGWMIAEEEQAIYSHGAHQNGGEKYMTDRRNRHEEKETRWREHGREDKWKVIWRSKGKQEKGKENE